MLIKFRLENYKSYKDATEFTMVAGKYQKQSHIFSKKKLKALKFSSIYGGNASGKSNLVDAIDITKHMILSGKVVKTFNDLFFKLDESMSTKPSVFEYEISIEEKIFSYGLAVNFSKNEILNEYLYEMKNGEEKLIFDFDYKENNFEFDSKRIKSKDNKTKIDVYLDDFKNSTNKNEFFLTFLKKKNFNKVEPWIEDIQSVFNWFKNTLIVITPNSSLFDITGLFDKKNIENRETPLELIKKFDTGITNIDSQKISLQDFKSNLKRKIPTDAEAELKDLFNKIDELKNDQGIGLIVLGQNYKIYREEDTIKIENLNFIHCDNNSVGFDLNEESDGTKRLIELVNILYLSQFENKVFIVDELNRSLHPNLTKNFVEKFLALSEGNESQLIITTHETSLMNLKFLRQDELWFVDRHSDGFSKLFPLTDFDVRSDTAQLDKNYLTDRYGGVPRFEKFLQTGESNG